MEKQGEVYLVGAGPGDPRLITEKGLRCLQRCDAVVYDSLASERLLEYAPAECERIYVGKRAGHHSMKQEEINRILVGLAQKGRSVVRLKGGDPFVFGRGGEEVGCLKEAGIPYEVVPGVTSAVAALSAAGIPVTHRAVSRSFHVMTGHTLTDCDTETVLPDDFESFAKLSGTLVFLMGLGTLPLIVRGLMENGKSGSVPAAVIENGTLPEQRVVRGTLSTIVSRVREEKIKTPAIIVVGEVASLNMSSTITLPLQGVRIGVTGTDHFTKKLRKLLEDHGAETEVVCSLGIEAYSDSKKMERAYEELPDYTWLAFTSANAVRLFFLGLLKKGMDLRAVGHLKLAAIGRGTAEELAKLGFLADFIPNRFTASELALGLAKLVTGTDRVLIPRAAKGSPELSKIFEEAKVRYQDIALYDVVSRKKAGNDLSGQLCGLDYLTFASASGVKAFFEDLNGEEDRALNRIKIACIGDITAKALKEHGRLADLVATEFSIPGLAAVICQDRKGKRKEDEHQPITETI